MVPALSFVLSPSIRFLESCAFTLITWLGTIFAQTVLSELVSDIFNAVPNASSAYHPPKMFPSVTIFVGILYIEASAPFFSKYFAPPYVVYVVSLYVSAL